MTPEERKCKIFFCKSCYNCDSHMERRDISKIKNKISAQKRQRVTTLPAHGRCIDDLSGLQLEAGLENLRFTAAAWKKRGKCLRLKRRLSNSYSFPSGTLNSDGFLCEIYDMRFSFFYSQGLWSKSEEQFFFSSEYKSRSLFILV